MKRTITINVAGIDAATRDADKWNKQVIFKKCASFTNYISKINNRQVHDTTDRDAKINIKLSYPK